MSKKPVFQLKVFNYRPKNCIITNNNKATPPTLSLRAPAKQSRS